MKHHVRTRSLQSLALPVAVTAVPTPRPSPSGSPLPPTEPPQPAPALKPSATTGSGAVGGVRVGVETRLLWQLGEAMTASTSFDDVDGFGPLPLTAGAECMPLTQPKHRAVPVDALFVSGDAVQQTEAPTAAPPPPDLLPPSRGPGVAGAGPKKRAKHGPLPTKARPDDVVDVDEEAAPAPPPQDDYRDIDTFASAGGGMAVGGSVGLDACPRSREEWMKQRRRVVLASQDSFHNSGRLLQDLRPNFIILYDPDPGKRKFCFCGVWRLECLACHWGCLFVVVFNLCCLHRVGAGDRGVPQLPRCQHAHASVSVGVRGQR